MPTNPGSLALTSIADGSLIVAADHRNNYSAIQVGVNGLVAMFAAVAAKGDLLVGSGANAMDHLTVGANGLVPIADSSQALGIRWGSAALAPYRKTTAKTVNTTVAATDLLNGEITVAANQLGTSGVLRLTATGDFVNNSGGSVAAPRFQVILGGTTLLDTAAGGIVGNSSVRSAWRIQVEISELGATNLQQTHMLGFLQTDAINTLGATAFATGEGKVLEDGQHLVTYQGINGTAVDMTAARALVLNVINGSASATYETKLLDALVEVI